MITDVDSSVLLDVLLEGSEYALASENALKKAASEGSLIIGDVAIAEISPVLKSEDLKEFLSDWDLQFVPSSRETAILAGEIFRHYLSRKGAQKRVLPDFLIAAHAQNHADRILARDRGYYRDYFRRLKVWDPSKPMR